MPMLRSSTRKRDTVPTSGNRETQYGPKPQLQENSNSETGDTQVQLREHPTSGHNPTYADEFPVEDIVGHDYDPDTGKLLYQVRWFGYSPREDTMEPIYHIPRSRVLSYIRRRRLALPRDIDDAMLG